MKSGQITDIFCPLTTVAHAKAYQLLSLFLELTGCFFFSLSVIWVELLTELNPNTLKSVSTMTIFSTQLLQYLTALCVCLSGSGQERDACSDIVQGNHVDSAVHQKLLPVGEFSEEPASLPGEVL